ncbi:ABC transporter ATP-binding protein [soil metagenome]
MIEVRDMTFAYPDGKLGGKRAVDGISFSVEPGEIFGFLGPSGAGKSTTQKVLIGLLQRIAKLLTHATLHVYANSQVIRSDEVTCSAYACGSTTLKTAVKGYAGEIEVLGKDLSTWGAGYYEKIGVSFELPNHYQKLTALENLNFFRSLYATETEEPMDLLEMVGLTDDADTRISRFSKGMQMRLTFARALLNRPELLFLDEPTSGLDPVNARKVKEAVLGLKREGRTIFLTTHDMTVAEQLCDRVAFIVDGRIAVTDSPRGLKIREGERKVRVEYRNGEGGGRTGHHEFSLDGLGDDDEFLSLIRSGQIETIHTEEATLEDVFIEATGRTLA